MKERPHLDLNGIMEIERVEKADPGKKGGISPERHRSSRPAKLQIVGAQ